MGRKDYYEILGIPKDASTADVKKAYRDLAKKHHPDKGGDSEKFKEIGEAYEILSDKGKKAAYDNPARQMNDASFRNGNIDDLVNEFMFGGNRRRHKNFTTVKMDISLEDAYKGAYRKVQYHRNRINGQPVTCSACGGNGYIDQQMNFGMGRMIVNRTTCQVCGGQGTYYPTTGETITLDINIPKGCPENFQLLYTGGGNETAPNHFEDMVFVIGTVESEDYQRQGQDLLKTHPIPFPMLILGGEIVVDIFGSKYKFKIEGGSKALQIKRLKHQGFRFEGRAGDLYVQPIPELPDALNEKEKKILKDLMAQEHFKL